MLLSAKEMRSLSFTILCQEIRETWRMINFFICTDCIPRSKIEERWITEVETIDDVESLDRRLLILRIRAKNLREEILFSQRETQ
jgi:hypothetical protein